MATTFIGTIDDDIIKPGLVSPGVQTIEADATPGDGGARSQAVEEAG